MADLSAFPPHIQSQIEALLSAPVLARLATANPTSLQPHVVPVWFSWENHNIWISSFSSTRKIRDLRANPRCAVLVEPASGEVELQAVLLEGVVELIDEPRTWIQEVAAKIYSRYLGSQGLLDAEPQSWLADPENMIIKLIPEKIRAW